MRGKKTVAETKWKMDGLVTPIRVGAFLAVRQIFRSGRGTAILISLVMTLTFLNLTVVSGILIGLIEGSSIAYRKHYSGDLLLATLSNKAYIERSQDLTGQISGFSEVRAVSGRLIVPAAVTANWKDRSGVKDLPDSTGASATGINPLDEDAVTHLSRYVISGKYLEKDSQGEVLVGSGLLAEYSRVSSPGQSLLSGVHVGDKVRLSVGGQPYEVTVRGIVKSKIGQVNQRVFMPERELRQLLGRQDQNMNEIAVLLDTSASPESVKKELADSGVGRYADILTWREAQGSFFEDLSVTFRILGDFIGYIALSVAALTVFIVVLINAITRKRQIGIMKGIGICSRTISWAYVIQALIYASIGTAVGLAALYGLIKPYFDANPIDFPFSDGILVATPAGVAWRAGTMFLLTALAGWLPARSIVRRNTLDTILGR